MFTNSRTRVFVQRRWHLLTYGKVLCKAMDPDPNASLLEYATTWLRWGLPIELEIIESTSSCSLFFSMRIRRPAAVASSNCENVGSYSLIVMSCIAGRKRAYAGGSSLFEANTYGHAL